MENSNMNKRRRIEEAEEDQQDRLGDLTDSLLLHILSFVSLKDCKRTCVLSRRWINLWKMMPVLDFDSRNFKKLSSFNKFVDNVLNFHDDSFKIETLTFNGIKTFNHKVCSKKLLRKVQDFAVSHNAKSLDIFVSGCRSNSWPVRLGRSSDSLTSLALRSLGCFSYPIPGEGCFKKLKDLHLEGALIIETEPFSRFPNLEKLILECCSLSPDVSSLTISAPQLSSLKIFAIDQRMSRLNLTTPKLKFFEYRGPDFPLLQPHQVLPVLDTAIIDYLSAYNSQSQRQVFDNLLVMLERLQSASSLTLFYGVLELLSHFPYELAATPSYFHNLKSLNLSFKHYVSQNLFESFLIPSDVTACLLKNSPVTTCISPVIVNTYLDNNSPTIAYLLKNSPEAEFIIRFYRPIR